MDTWVWIVLVLAVLVIIALAGMLWRQRKQAGLAQKFGPEYERTVSETGGTRQAHAELDARQKRVEALNIRPLAREDQKRFAEQWHRVQADFVDDPSGAITEADRLVATVMETRGYPVGHFGQRAADISVDHPLVVENYRAANAIAIRNMDGHASTEDLRQAMKHYRALFDDLLEANQPIRQEAQR